MRQLLWQDTKRFKGKATLLSTQRSTSPPLPMPDNSMLPSSDTDMRKQSKKDKGKKATLPSTQQPSNCVDNTLTKAPPPQPKTSMQLTSNNSIEGTLTQPPSPQHKMSTHTLMSPPLPQPPSMNNSVNGTSQPKEVPVNYIVATETMTTIMSITSTVAVGTDGIPSFAAMPSSTAAYKDKEEVPMLNAPTTGNTTKEGTEGSTNEVCVNSLYGFITNS
jgi:hypothetical protein